ncbi:DUF2184 domain-containing protein [Acetobacteraceae bacterium EV16G]|uniref:DUF2184 domain-containing protein n=1 Tax=Sorlinia euscelidii TaxID=3081148 RepID=A0ABU7U127_9PROT
MRHPDLVALERDWGVTGDLRHVSRFAHDAQLAMDAASGPITQANIGIPSLFTTWVDPTIIETIVTPTKSEEVYGSAKKGDWITSFAQFPMVEYSGDVAAYEDYSRDGMTGANVNWEVRQSFHYQTYTEWGEREGELMGAAQLDWISRKNLASIAVLNKAQNAINLYGISGLQLRGALNDADLPPAIQPTPKTNASGGAASGNTWFDTSDPLQVYSDILSMYTTALTQMAGNLTLETPMKLVIPTTHQTCLLYANQYKTTVKELLKENLPNLEIVSLPEAGVSLSGGQSKVTQAQLFVKQVEGQETVTTAFTEKLRAHRVENFTSYTRQKKSQGTWGTIWRYPLACVTMVGI